MNNAQSAIDSTYKLIRNVYTDLETFKSANTIARAKLEISIKSNLQTIANRITDVERMSQDLPLHEKSRILPIIKDLHSNHRNLASSLYTPKKTDIELSVRPATDYSSQSNGDLIRQQALMKKKQEAEVDQLIMTIENVKNTGREIGDELDFHIKLLDKTEAGVDRNIERISETSEKIMRLVDRSSNSCLMIIIIVLVILILLTILYL